jgi:hypothetical protein
MMKNLTKQGLVEQADTIFFVHGEWWLGSTAESCGGQGITKEIGNS